MNVGLDSTLTVESLVNVNGVLGQSQYLFPAFLFYVLSLYAVNTGELVEMPDK